MDVGRRDRVLDLLCARVGRLDPREVARESPRRLAVAGGAVPRRLVAGRLRREEREKHIGIQGSCGRITARDR
jgi:hypothetical protein